MVVGRWIGWALAVAAAVLLVAEIVRSAFAGSYEVLAAAEVWYTLNANSLVGFGALIEKNLSPTLWSAVLVPVLSLPAWLLLGVIAMIVLFAFRGRRRRRPTFSRS